MKPWIETHEGKWVNTRNIIYVAHNGGTELHLNDGDVIEYSEQQVDLMKLIQKIGGKTIEFGEVEK